MRVGETESLVPASKRKAIAQRKLADLDRMASKADDLIGESFMISRSLKGDRISMDGDLLTDRRGYVYGARKLGAIIVKALRSENSEDVGMGASVRGQIEDAQLTNEYWQTMRSAIESARKEFIVTRKVRISGIGDAGLLDFEYGEYGMGLAEIFDEAGRIALERRNANRKSMKDRGWAREDMGYMAAASVLEALKKESEKVGAASMSGRKIYDRMLADLSQLSARVKREPIINTDLVSRPIESKLVDFLGGDEILENGTIVDRLGAELAPVSAIFMILDQVARGAAEGAKSMLEEPVLLALMR